MRSLCDVSRVPDPSSIAMLIACPWMQGLATHERQLVVDTARDRAFVPGEWIERAGTVVDHWTGVVDGFLKMSVTAADGRASTLTGVGDGVWYGEGSLMKHEPRRYDVFAVTAGRIVMIPRATFMRLRDTSIAFNHHLQELLNARLGLFIGALAHDRLLDTDARVAYCIGSLFNEELYPRASRWVQLDQRELGLLANVSRQRANVALNRLQQLGLIRIERAGLRVLDVRGLLAFAESREDSSAVRRVA